MLTTLSKQLGQICQPALLRVAFKFVPPVFIRYYNGQPSYEDKYDEEMSGQRLLEYWNHLLHRVTSEWPDTQTQYTEEQVRQLIHSAMRYRKSRYMFPEQFVSTLMHFYETILPPENRITFFRLLSKEFSVDNEEVEECVKVWNQVYNGDRKEAMVRCNEELHEATRPIYNSLWAPISQQPGGIRFMVKMREQLLDVIREESSTEQGLRVLSEQIKYHLADWFSLGLLTLDEVDWDKSTASLLEKAIGYEVIHPIRSWDELKKRFGQNRRVYAFSHLVFPEEPLVLLYVALSNKIEQQVDNIINHRNEIPESQCNTAIFYSIQTTQPGLSGIDLGHLLIKEVASKIISELPNITTLVTLSPIPNFRQWLMTRLGAELKHLGQSGTAVGSSQSIMSAVSFMLKPEEIESLYQFVLQNFQVQETYSRNVAALQFLYKTLQSNAWIDVPQLNECIRPVLMRLCAHYLLREKRRGLALDPVANFHLRNGARMHKLNWMADMKEERLQQSWGIMINYIYVISDVHTNNRAYLVDNVIVASSDFRHSLVA